MTAIRKAVKPFRKSSVSSRCGRCGSGPLIPAADPEGHPEDAACLVCGAMRYATPVLALAVARSEIEPYAGAKHRRRPGHGKLKL
jgi:hypothetical protein